MWFWWRANGKTICAILPNRNELRVKRSSTNHNCFTNQSKSQNQTSDPNLWFSKFYFEAVKRHLRPTRTEKFLIF